jgi:WD40 repeat protein
MFRCHLLLTLLLLVAAVADGGQVAPAAKDQYGDPLPAGAVARVGTIRWRHDGRVGFAAFLPGGKTVLTAADDYTLRVWDFPSGKELHRFGSPAQESGPHLLVAAALTPDGKTFATYFADRGTRPRDPAVYLHDVVTGKELRKLEMTDASVLALAFSANGEMLDRKSVV